MTSPGSFRILVICSGNVCRSPLVELLLRERLGVGSPFQVQSAGTIARPGQRMTREMVQVAVGLGVSADVAEAHGAARLTERAVAEADVIFGLSRAHRAAAVELQPGAVKRAFTLVEFARLVEALPSERRDVTAAELIAQLSVCRGPGAEAEANTDDIEDPIGQARDVYQRVGAQISAAVEVIARALLLTRADGLAKQQTTSVSGPSLKFSFRPA